MICAYDIDGVCTSDATHMIVCNPWFGDESEPVPSCDVHDTELIELMHSEQCGCVVHSDPF